MEMLAAIIFVLMYVLIVSEKVHRTIVAMMGAILMIIVGIMMFQLKQKKKLAGTLIVAFGLVCIVAAIMEILSAMGKTF